MHDDHGGQGCDDYATRSNAALRYDDGTDTCADDEFAINDVSLDEDRDREPVKNNRVLYFEGATGGL